MLASINPFTDPTPAFGLGLFLGIFVFFIAEVVFSLPKKEEKECPVCKEVREAQEEEEKRLYKEWEEQQKGYKN